jgi:CHAP domain-containing protein
MRSLMAHRLLWGACLAAGVVASAKSSAAANCALYAREVTGVALFGAAGGWWAEAHGRYERGQVPAVGSILVFKRTQRIPSGHVAVVARIVSADEILVDHANWYHGTVSRGMSVIDTSPAHDWTNVAVLHTPSGTHGADYPTYGFVHPRPAQQEIIEAHDRSGFAPYLADGNARPALFQLAVATEEDMQSGSGMAAKIPGTHHPKEAAARPQRKAAHPYTHGVAHHKPSSARAAAPQTLIAHPPSRPVRTTEAKHHRA